MTKIDPTQMRPFDLQKWKAGAKVCYRNGEVPDYVWHAPNMQAPWHLVSAKGDMVRTHTTVGKFLNRSENSHHDLMLIAETREEWRWMDENGNVSAPAPVCDKQGIMDWGRETGAKGHPVKLTWEE